ncbi:MAG TPA: restriction endonuclease, partial [Burkholderiaceae bacterium]|nr:restriction endonuclease [Burkholderiaceae bacterium]
MKFRMAERSLFAVLLRSSWWISLALAAGFALVARLVLPADLFWFGAMGGLPFVVIAVMAARRQLREPGAALVQRTLDAVRAMAWREFAAVLQTAWQREGFDVDRLQGTGDPGADLALHKAGVTTLVLARRWKAANLGVEPLREFKAAIDKAGARDGLVVVLGELTP